MIEKTTPAPAQPADATNPAQPPKGKPAEIQAEIGGYQGPDPTRHGDWAHKGRCTDF